MNFLLNAIEANDDDFGDDGGWGSDDDIDLSEEEEDYDTETTGYDTEATPQPPPHTLPETPAPPPPPPGSSPMMVAGGMFMGRLTQFMDTVAPQQVEGEDLSEGDGDGWADDDLDVDDDVDAGGWANDDDALSFLADAAEGAIPAANDTDTSMYSNQAVVAPVASPFPSAAQVPPANPSTSFGGESQSTSAAVGMASVAGMDTIFDAKNEIVVDEDEDNDNGAGWDDDDGLVFDNEVQNDSLDVGNAIEADITFEKEPVRLQTAEPIPVPPPPTNGSDDGWDDDNNMLFDDVNVDDAAEGGDVVETDLAAEKTTGSPQLFDSISAPPSPQAPIDNSNNDEGAGWDDDDGLLFDDDNIENLAEAVTAMEKETEPSQPMESAPPPPSPPPTTAPFLGFENADPSVSFGGESLSTTDAVGIASTADITNDFDVGNSNDNNDGNDAVDAAGWDDDDGLLDDVVESNISMEKEIDPSQPMESAPPPPPPPPVLPLGFANADPSVSFGGESLSTTNAVGMISTDDITNDFDAESSNNNNDGNDAVDAAGWDDDDDLLDDVVEIDVTAEIEMESTQLVDSASPPPPPPPPVQAADISNDFDAGNNNSNDVVAEAGWDDDGGLLDDLVETDGIVEKKLVGSTTSHPPPPPPVQTADNINDFSVETDNDVIDGAGWDDDDGLLDDVVEADVIVETKLVSSTTSHPPPPPPVQTADNTNAFSVESDTDVVDGVGWDDDDGLLDDVVEADVIAETKLESLQLVDSTPPPPPPPPVQTAVSDDNAFALDNDDGWGDDDDLAINISDDFDGDSAIQENKNVVDHIPSPSLRKFSDPATIDATDGDDDISQDDTLSIANSRSQQNAVSGFNRAMSNSTIGDEDIEPATQVSVTEIEAEPTDATIRSVSTFGGSSGRLASRKVVDYTPRRSRFSGNDSLMVSGHTSVGESLDSIDEANEEDYENELDLDNAENLRRLSGVIVPVVGDSQEETVITPRTMESGWGALRQQSQSTPSKTEQDFTEIPFGSALTPTAANSNNIPSRFPILKNEGTIVKDAAESPLVDHTPGITDISSTGFRHARKPSVATSIEVRGDDSSEGDLGETDTVGVDDIKDELYGPMVDQIPPTPEDNSPRRRRKISSGQASVGSTVVGQAENKDIQKDIREDDAMDEEEEGGEDGSRGWGSMLEYDNRSLLSGLPLPVVDETQYLVDHVPVDKLLRGGGAASTMVMMDASTASSRAEDNVDGSNHVDFGPIVDHTPSLPGPSRGAPSIATSVATAVSGLDGDIKEDDDMDNTTVAGGTVVSAGPREDEDLDKVEDNHIVDHVPEGKGPPVIADASVRVLVGKDDDMTQVDTIAEDVAREFGPIVDHTPLPFSRVTSGGISVGTSFRAQRSAADDNNTATIASLSQADENSGWDHDEPDLDDLSRTDIKVALTGVTKEESNLVDRIPRSSYTKPVDGSTIVLIDPVDAVSEVDDADDDTAGNARVDKFGPVVDHTPAPQSASMTMATSMANQASGGTESDDRPDADIDGSATWFGASTLGGISSTGGDDDSGTGWDEDDQADLTSPVVPRPLLTSVIDHLVDHIPSLASTRNVDANASIAVAIDPSVVSNQTQEDKMGGGIFGAVVDHTPSVDPITRRSAENSTMVTGFATNTKLDEEMDETTWQGGVSAQGEGWDQDDRELEELANNGEDTSPHLVDHVPERPESRYGDPSLIVAANPSEMSSQVEDLNQDENQFGPVVDQTPLERVLPPPAVGSTVVALPSILNDVSDEGDNDGSNVESARVPNEWEEQMPNPQSGIDADSTREQLVDAVPPPPPPEQQPMARDASSEMAFVDDKSTLIPADEPKEDEFGPVVDHTPMGDPTDGIEIRNRDEHSRDDDGDKKLASNLDSVAPIYSVESKEKQDGLDEDEFGPVVDQLPASSSKSSLAPSTGGSTMDALATVSEGEDDLNTRDGWDDDTLDLIDQVSPANMSHRANHSVTWEDNVFQGKDESDPKAIDVSKQSDDVRDSTFFTAAETNESSLMGLDETKFYDAEDLSEVNGWGNDSLNIADDDTPPTTPRPSAAFKKKPMVDCSTMDTTDFPCVRTPPEMNRDKKAVMGGSVKVGLQKLLQEEMAKTILLEKESGALRKMVDSLKDAKELLMTAAKQQFAREDELMDAISKWQEANGQLSEDISKHRDEIEKLSVDNLNFQSQNANLSEDATKFRNENGLLSSTNRKLSEDLVKIERECTKLKNRNDHFSNEVDNLRKSISELEDEKSEIFARETALNAEITNLKASLEKRLHQATSDTSLREDIRSAQLELSAKANECSQLNSQLILVQEKLRKSEAQNFRNTKELGKMTKDHMQKILGLQTQLVSYEKDLEEARSRNEQSTADLERRLSSEAASNQKLQQENTSLLQQKNLLQVQFQNTALGSQHELSQKEAEIQSLGAQLKSAQDNNMCLTDHVNSYAQQVERLTSISAQLESITRERDVLKEELVDNKTYIASLQKQFNDLNSLLGLNDSKPESVVKAIQNERDKQLQEIDSSRNQISNLKGRLNKIESQKNSIQAQFEEFRKSHDNSEKASALLALTAIKEESKLKKILDEVHRLRTELQNVSNELQNTESERTRLSDKVAELGEVVAQTDRLQEDLLQFQKSSESQGQCIKILESNITENERALTSKDQEIVSLREQQRSNESRMMSIEHEKQELLAKLEEMNAYTIQLDSEREAFSTDADEKNSTLDSLNEQLQLLTEERDILLDEKENFEADIEDMLVQFGLLNEEMVEKEAEMVRAEEQLAKLEEGRQIDEKELQDVKNEAQSYKEHLEDEKHQHEQTQMEKDELLREKESKEIELGNDLQIAHRKYEMSEEKLNALIRESEEMTRNVGDVDENTKKLIEVNTALRDKIWTMASEQSASAEKIEAMESDKMGLNGKVDVLQNLVDELIASFEAREAKLQSIIDDINIQKEEIANRSLSQKTEITRLSQELVMSKGVAEECTELRYNLTDMENKLYEQDRLLLQKDAAAQDLFNQLQNAGTIPVESAEMEMLRETVRDLGATVANDKKQLQEMGGVCDETQQELKRITEQLQVSEKTAQQLENDLQSKQSVESTNEMLESRLDQLEQELMNARNEETKHRIEATDLKLQVIVQQSSKEQSSEVLSAELATLREQVDALEQEKEALSSEAVAREEAMEEELQLSRERDSEVSAELATLRQQVEALHQEKETSSSAASAREEAMERELRALQDQMEEKDAKIASMEDILVLVDEDLNQSKEQSNEKQESINVLTADMEALKTLASQSHSLQVLKDNNTMQTQLVTLAEAFAHSETSRAEVLEKIEAERQAHAESLRRMTVNMKRFYATLSMSDV